MTTPSEHFVADLLSRAEIIETPCGDGTMQWQRWGAATSKPPLVLLHGGYGSWTHWMANVERLSADRLVVTCDTPGMGESAIAPGGEFPDAIAKPIADGLPTVLDGAVPFDLAGFSFGGLVGGRVSAMTGAACRKFIAVGASGFEGLHVRVLDLQIPGPGSSAEEIMETHRRNLAILMLNDEKKIDDVALHTHERNISRARVRSRPMSLGNHLVDVLPRIKAETHGIWGIHDATGGGRELLLKRGEILKSHCPAATLTILEDAGHWVMYEQPEEFEAALLAVLDQ